MKKSNKIIIGVIAVVLVASVAVLAGQSELFQGRLNFLKFSKVSPVTQTVDYSRLFWYKGEIVSAVTSPVTSPVPSVVVSDVTSPGGTSGVASVVTSPIASPIASAVAVDKKTASKVNTKKLKTFTEKTLQSIAKQDYRKNKKSFEKKAQEYYKKNPGKFTLNLREKQTLIDLYKRNNPSEFIFRSAR